MNFASSAYSSTCSLQVGQIVGVLGLAGKPYLAAPLAFVQSEPLGNTAVVRARAAAILAEAVTTIAALCRSFLRRA